MHSHRGLVDVYLSTQLHPVKCKIGSLPAGWCFHEGVMSNGRWGWCLLFHNKHHYCACVHLPLPSASELATAQSIQLRHHGKYNTEQHQGDSSKTRKCPIIHYWQRTNYPFPIQLSGCWCHTEGPRHHQRFSRKERTFHPFSPKMHSQTALLNYVGATPTSCLVPEWYTAWPILSIEEFWLYSSSPIYLLEFHRYR